MPGGLGGVRWSPPGHELPARFAGRGVGIHKILGHCRRGKRHDQAYGDDDLLHWGSFERALRRLAAKVRRVDVREIFGHGGGGKRHDQGNGNQKLLHRGLS